MIFKKTMSAHTMQDIAQVIREGNDFLLSTHINPDGDGIGAVLAFEWVLKKMGKTYISVIDANVPEMFKYLTGSGEILSYYEGIKPDFVPQVIICLDIPNMKRLKRVNDLIPEGAKIVNIDHHYSNDSFGHINLLDFQASSCSEIVFPVLDALGLTIDRDVAEHIYTGIVIDTGRFRFSNTTAEVLRISAKLIEAGARADFIAEQLFHTNTFETLIGLSEVLKTTEIYLSGKLAISVLNYDCLDKIDINVMETEGFVDYPLSINGVKVGVLLQVSKDGGIRGSLRSKVDNVNVSTIAETFSGGGHKRAAGFQDETTVEEVKQKVIQEVKKFI